MIRSITSSGFEMPPDQKASQTRSIWFLMSPVSTRWVSLQVRNQIPCSVCADSDGGNDRSLPRVPNAARSPAAAHPCPLAFTQNRNRAVVGCSGSVRPPLLSVAAQLASSSASTARLKRVAFFPRQ